MIPPLVSTQSSLDTAAIVRAARPEEFDDKAVLEKELSRVCFVVTDLTGTAKLQRWTNGHWVGYTFKGTGKKIFELTPSARKIKVIPVLNGDRFWLTEPQAKMACLKVPDDGSRLDVATQDTIKYIYQPVARSREANAPTADVAEVLDEIMALRATRSMESADASIVLPVGRSAVRPEYIPVLLANCPTQNLKLTLSAIAGNPVELRSWDGEAGDAFLISMSPTAFEDLYREKTGFPPDPDSSSVPALLTVSSQDRTLFKVSLQIDVSETTPAGAILAEPNGSSSRADRLSYFLGLKKRLYARHLYSECLSLWANAIPASDWQATDPESFSLLFMVFKQTAASQAVSAKDLHRSHYKKLSL